MRKKSISIECTLFEFIVMRSICTLNINWWTTFSNMMISYVNICLGHSFFGSSAEFYLFVVYQFWRVATGKNGQYSIKWIICCLLWWTSQLAVFINMHQKKILYYFFSFELTGSIEWRDLALYVLYSVLHLNDKELILIFFLIFFRKHYKKNRIAFGSWPNFSLVDQQELNFVEK